MGIALKKRKWLYIRLVFDFILIYITILAIFIIYALVNKAKMHQISKEDYLLYKQCREKFDMMNMSGVSKCLDELILVNPYNYNAIYDRATIYEYSGMKHLAIKQYNEVMRLRPTYVKSYLKAGYLNDKLGNIDQAISEYNKAISVVPRCDEAYSNICSMHRKSKQFSNALVACNKGC